LADEKAGGQACLPAGLGGQLSEPALSDGERPKGVEPESKGASASGGAPLSASEGGAVHAAQTSPPPGGRIE